MASCAVGVLLLFESGYDGRVAEGDRMAPSGTQAEARAEQALPVKVSREDGRLEFLDAARGIAAVGVVIQHSLESSVPWFKAWSAHHVNLGAFGLVLFFIVSGFIIPVSLWRAKRLSTFWASRFFRLYPMYWVSLLVALILGLGFGVVLSPEFRDHPVVGTLVNATMLQTFVGVPDAVGVYWTLSLELVFYVVCSALFALGWLGRSLLWAWVAMGTMALTTLVAGRVLHHSLPAGRMGLLVTAFAGTVLFKVSKDELPKRVLYAAAPALVASLGIGFWYRFQVYPSRSETDAWNLLGVSVSWALGYVTFGILFWLRGYEFPGWLTWMGRISYSLYLIHGLALVLVPRSWVPAVYVPAVLGVSMALSAVTYQYIERPAIAMYRRRMRRAELGQEPGLAAG